MLNATQTHADWHVSRDELSVADRQFSVEVAYPKSSAHVARSIATRAMPDLFTMSPTLFGETTRTIIDSPDGSLFFQPGNQMSIRARTSETSTYSDGVMYLCRRDQVPQICYEKISTTPSSIVVGRNAGMSWTVTIPSNVGSAVIPYYVLLCYYWNWLGANPECAMVRAPAHYAQLCIHLVHITIPESTAMGVF